MSDKDTQMKGGWTRGKLNKRSIIDEREARRRNEDNDNRKTTDNRKRIERLNHILTAVGSALSKGNVNSSFTFTITVLIHHLCLRARTIID